MNSGLENKYIIKNNKKMRYGYTTGSCATAAAKGAARMLLSGERTESVELMTPKGILLHLPLEQIQQKEQEVICAVRKDAGDDPDMTNGILVYATVRYKEKPDSGQLFVEKEIQDPVIDGGEGVGRITRKGLEQPVGNAAINRVPREMITHEIRKVCQEQHFSGRLEVIISVPDGEQVAKKTFNPRLGILGGISILGTSGIVEPMSESALIKSIEVEMSMKLHNGEQYLLITPGNYGAEYLREHMDLPFEKNMKCSNFVGETVDMAVSMGAKGILFISHIGKFVKVAGGIMNTHSRNADCRMEILCAQGMLSGLSPEGAVKLMDAPTTDEALKVLEEEQCLGETMNRVMDRIEFYLNHRAYDQLELGAVVFSNTYGYLGKTSGVDALINKLQGEKE